jgi:hypothetical protein
MSDLDPDTGRPLDAPVPPESPPSGIGTSAFPADRSPRPEAASGDGDDGERCEG